MVAQREQENEDLYRAWAEQQRRRMAPDEEEEDYVGDFKQENVRRSFIRKIFCILTLQLLFTTCMIAIFLFVLVSSIVTPLFIAMSFNIRPPGTARGSS